MLFLDEKRLGETQVDIDRDVKRRALAWLHKNGWCQRGYTEGPAGCVVTALRAASDIDAAFDIAFRLKGGHSRLVCWNDAPWRTFADVEALLSK